ncbi:MAG: hypothetical protein CMI02_09625 [Oceanospirillaceae bacterium]|nr:hypothetical protein [Oceanospirillaceae bacterium]
MNHRAILHNARRAFAQAPVTSDLRAAMGHSGQLLDRYTRALPDTPAALRTREALTDCAERYLKRCRRAASHNPGAQQ